MPIITTDGYSIKPTALISAPLAFPNYPAWSDLGQEIDVGSMKSLTLYLQLKINLSANMRLRIKTKIPLTQIEYSPSFKPVTTSVDAKADEYVEFDVDADQNPQIFFDLKGCVQTVQVQIQAGTIGATPAEVTTAFYAASK